MGETHRVRYGAGTRASMLSSTPPLSTVTVPSPGALSLTLQGIPGALSLRAGLIKLLVVGDEVRLQPLPPPWPWAGVGVQGAYE